MNTLLACHDWLLGRLVLAKTLGRVFPQMCWGNKAHLGPKLLLFSPKNYTPPRDPGHPGVPSGEVYVYLGLSVWDPCSSVEDEA